MSKIKLNCYCCHAQVETLYSVNNGNKLVCIDCLRRAYCKLIKVKQYARRK
ncbi:hypothetical protein LCGC14_0872630 [marine sediment metagenome]|uniref:Uncharacterized protein n=1 Tax=marine sediment metagenome TaxID=412755 RepID=A0A0F9P468_9ZZZZ